MRVFLDTNVLAYSADQTDIVKNGKAISIVQSALKRKSEFAISVQVLTEFCNVALRKLSMPQDSVLDFLRMFRKIDTVLPDADLVVRGVEIRTRYGIQYYDSLMIAAAERIGAAEIWTEDLADGQTYCGVKAVNPFK